ncbi:ATP-dependent DNA ligase [Saccharomonospora piscinae]|uniref:ATP-dependent DNA ligase n=1 Tax=Saccharomonospora piscinae TaxID=687388 RepID=UPI0011061ECA|nr:ATP-dependent DNA ligase [Saccharomonospora piscinae]TLW91843.1 ATP-dependent DNA ligase [Saccharomonospora piscinae]
MQLHDVVTASARLAATRSRKAKTAVLADLLSGAAADELAAAVAFLTGQPTQGRIGVGWRTLTALRTPPATSAELTVSEVDAALGAVAGTSGSGSASRRGEKLHALLAGATADEQDFLLRLLTGELRQGALEGVMVEAVAAAAGVPAEAVRRAFMLSGRLPAAAHAAMAGGVAALREFRIELGRPLRPMLASPADSLTGATAELGAVSVEYKLDGARIQVHRDGGDVRVYTRTLREVTDHVAELAALVRDLPCRAVVLDGETLALTDDGRPRPFQETMSRFGSTREEQVRQLLLRPYFFDCLHLDGADLLDAPLRERQAALRTVAADHLVPGERAPRDPDEVLAASLRDGHEGVVVKALDSPYAAGRRGRAWLKVKPVHTLDLVVLAAEWGHGRRRGFLSNLHLGARDPDGGPPIMVGKTFKGLTDELLTWQTETFPRYESHRDSAAVFLRPALVVEIELDGAQVSTRYPGGVALRFARVVRYRPDKEPSDADTIDAVRALAPGGR